MGMTTCPAKIRPLPDDTEVTCDRTPHLQSDLQHRGTLRDYAYPGSATAITWLETDRRTFTGEYVECPVASCVLPAGHPRDHAS